MRSMFVLLCARSAVAQATECQVAEETTMLQARQLVQKHMRAADTKGLNAKGLVKSLEHVANNFASMSTDEVNEALAAAAEALATLSPAIQKQVGFLQDAVNHAVAAVEACHGDAGVVQRAGLWEQAEAQAVISATCEAELATAVADEAQICSAVSVADVQSECACNEATARREDKEELCATILTGYEFAYCEHNLQCNTYHGCHQTETAVYNQVRDDVDAEMGPVELEYIAAQQSTCIVGVIQANMLAGGAMDFVAIAACSAVDTSALLLVHPDLPAAPEACPAATTGSPLCVHDYVVFDQANAALTVSPGSVSGDGQLNWNTAANSAREISANDGICGISFKCNTAASHLMVGLASSNVGRWPDIDYGVTCRGAWHPSTDIYENQQHVHRLADRAANGDPTTDVHAIQVNQNGEVEYSVGGSVYYTSSRAVTYPWHVGLDTYTAPSLSEVQYLPCPTNLPQDA